MEIHIGSPSGEQNNHNPESENIYRKQSVDGEERENGERVHKGKFEKKYI